MSLSILIQEIYGPIHFRRSKNYYTIQPSILYRSTFILSDKLDVVISYADNYLYL